MIDELPRMLRRSPPPGEVVRRGRQKPPRLRQVGEWSMELSASTRLVRTARSSPFSSGVISERLEETISTVTLG